jgi:hypothetical protein
MTAEINEGFPAWRYGPNGEESVFTTPDQVPKGWKEAPFASAPTAFDHDGDGKPGGSVAPEATDRLKDLRAEYRAQFGKKPFAGWDEDEIEKRIAAAQPAEIDTSEF